MRRQLTLAATAVLLGLPALPSYAAPHADFRAQQPVSGTAGGTTYAGRSCGVSAQNDSSGAVSTDPDFMIAQITGGPLTVTDPTTTDSTLVCSIQVNDPDHGGLMTAANVFTNPGPSVSVNDMNSYVNRHAPPADVIYVCTHLYWNSASGQHDVTVDMDPVAPGDQCDLVFSV